MEGRAMNSQFLFQLLYAIVASNGREALLFGDSFPAACEAFESSFDEAFDG